MDATKYNYLANSCHDISHAVGMASHFMEAPSEVHLVAMRWILHINYHAGPKGRPPGATVEGPSGGGAQAQVYKPSGPIVH